MPNQEEKGTSGKQWVKDKRSKGRMVRLFCQSMHSTRWWKDTMNVFVEWDHGFLYTHVCVYYLNSSSGEGLAKEKFNWDALGLGGST